jgi:2-methylcitrate dehydratase PrpD
MVGSGRVKLTGKQVNGGTTMAAITEQIPVEILSRHILETSFNDLDVDTIAKCRLRVIDVAGCAIGGANAPGNMALVDLIRNWGGKEEATVVCWGSKVPVGNAAMVNSILARSYDFEVMSPLIGGKSVPSHIAGTTVMTALSMAEAKGVDGKELITALVVGDDFASRVLAASGPGFFLGWDSVGMVNMLGATAIAGRLLGLTALQLRNALGLALNQMHGTFQSIWDGTTAFKLHQGTSARDGIFSAQLAQGGWTGAGDSLLSRFGYFNLYTDGCINPEILTKNLGKVYYADSTFKAYPCCRATHGALDCTLKIVSNNDLRPGDVAEVVIEVPKSHLENFIGQSFRIREFPQGDAAFSYRYTVASAIVRMGVRPEHFHEESIRDPMVNNLIEKVSLVELAGAQKLMNRVTIRMKDGREFSEFTDTPTGDPIGNPMSEDMILAKFRKNVEFSRIIAPETGEVLLALLGELEELNDAKRVTELLGNVH